jgi:hypothetical protein
MSRTTDDDALRQLEVKIAAATDARLRPALLALLVGTTARGPDRSMALELLGGLTVAAPDEGLPWYLLGRQYVNAGQFEDAVPRLDRALATELRIPRARVEAERLRLVSACALGDAAGAARLLTRYAAHPEVGEARREAARALVERCTEAFPSPDGAVVTPPAEGGSPAPGGAGYDGGPPAPGR